jgi:hypothetical protein
VEAGGGALCTKFYRQPSGAREGLFTKFPLTVDLVMDGRCSLCAFVHPIRSHPGRHAELQLNLNCDPPRRRYRKGRMGVVCVYFVYM